ncbi:MAG TPA: preprotein translocase subunit SecA, partial [Limnochordia bacterium]
INRLEPEMSRRSDAELRALTGEFKERIARGATLDELLPEAFAAVREAAKRTIGQRPFDVQLMGGIALHEGRIAEMKTGEGKTLAAVAPVYLNALLGRGVHVVTVNDYLARLHAEWMGAIYRFLGLSVGTILHGLDFAQRRQAYHADVTYGTNNEFGFDFLRDNMVQHASQLVQRELYYAIVDEVDSILIDEARTPLIISGPAEDSTEWYYRFARVVPRLKVDEDYTVDEKLKTVALTEEGVAKLEKMLQIDNLFDDRHFELAHYMQQALKAHALYKRDRDYVVKDGQVIIVDEFTGRLMFGRRYGDGLHQAIEAKEGVKIERETQTLASITFQNYFRMYEKLAGMTGTAATEETEFQKIYGMSVVVIPTNLPMIREDLPDLVFKTEKAKFEAIVDEIEALHKTGRPVLVGTISIEKSERLSELLSRRGIPHQVLNAKHHEREAELIAQAGRLGAVTIATNMAGRGTDIMLGGNPDYLAKQKMRQAGYPPAVLAEVAEKTPPSSPEVAAAREEYLKLYAEFKAQTDAEKEKVKALGGLAILGTERHESRRIDNQLRGRAGRQGDPGTSRFFVSMQDDLMRLFGSERITALMERLGWNDDAPIEHRQITRAIEKAQRKVEAHFFEMRKHVLEYDDVMNKQREVIYEQRRKVLRGENVQENILEMIGRQVRGLVDAHCPEKVHPEEWDRAGLLARFRELINQEAPLDPSEYEGLGREALVERLTAVAREAYAAREAQIGTDAMRELERLILLQLIDSKWMQHLRAMDELREGIGLRAYGQKDPLLEYKFEAYEMFKAMTDSIQEDVVRYLFRVQVRSPEERQRAEAEARSRLSRIVTNRTANGAPANRPAQPRRVEKRVGRNDPCPCGSGKKYKKCCGAVAAAASGR